MYAAGCGGFLFCGLLLGCWCLFGHSLLSQQRLLICNANSLLSFLPNQASCLEPPSHRIWLLVLLLLLPLYPPRACGCWPGDKWCPGTWSLHVALASTRFSAFSVDSPTRPCDDSSCLVLGGLFETLRGLHLVSCAQEGRSHSERWQL